MIKSETKTLQMTFLNESGKNTNLNVANPKTDLKKETVDAAAKIIVDNKVLNGKDSEKNLLALTALKSAQVVTRKVETLDAEEKNVEA